MLFVRRGCILFAMTAFFFTSTTVADNFMVRQCLEEEENICVGNELDRAAIFKNDDDELYECKTCSRTEAQNEDYKTCVVLPTCEKQKNGFQTWGIYVLLVVIVLVIIVGSVGMSYCMKCCCFAVKKHPAAVQPVQSYGNLQRPGVAPYRAASPMYAAGQPQPMYSPMYGQPMMAPRMPMQMYGQPMMAAQPQPIVAAPQPSAPAPLPAPAQQQGSSVTVEHKSAKPAKSAPTSAETSDSEDSVSAMVDESNSHKPSKSKR